MNLILLLKTFDSKAKSSKEVYKASVGMKEMLTDDQATHSVSISRMCGNFLDLTQNKKVVLKMSSTNHIYWKNICFGFNDNNDTN